MDTDFQDDFTKYEILLSKSFERSLENTKYCILY